MWYLPALTLALSHGARELVAISLSRWERVGVRAGFLFPAQRLAVQWFTTV